MNNKHKVFISSTYTDLVQHRKVLIDTLHRMQDLDVICMEYFGASPETPKDFSIENLIGADVYVGVFGWRYGTIVQPSKMSITEMEYRAALGYGIPCLIYLMDPNHALQPASVDVGSSAKKIRLLRDEISNNHTISFFSTPEDLARQVVSDLHRFFQDRNQSRNDLEEDKISVEGPVDCDINPAHPFSLCHLARKSKGANPYDILLYIDVYDNDLSKCKEHLSSIDLVVYQLHNTFTFPVVALRNWDQSFLLRISVWGEFWVQATAFFKDKTKKPLRMIRYLNFNLDGTLLENYLLESE